MEQADSVDVNNLTNDVKFSNQINKPASVGGLFAKSDSSTIYTTKPAGAAGFSFGSNYIPMTQEQTDYKIYDNRIRTFAMWPYSARVNPQAIALAGFKYTGFGDKCQCCFCHLQISQFQYFDDPMSDHKKFNPTCPYLMMIQPYQK